MFSDSPFNHGSQEEDGKMLLQSVNRIKIDNLEKTFRFLSARPPFSDAMCNISVAPLAKTNGYVWEKGVKSDPMFLKF